MNEFTPHDAIYLQVGDLDEPIRIDETTWCSDKINDGDVKYLLATSEREAASVLYRALSFAKSVIKSGEPWSDTCEEIIQAAIDLGVSKHSRQLHFPAVSSLKNTYSIRNNHND